MSLHGKLFVASSIGCAICLAGCGGGGGGYSAPLHITPPPSVAPPPPPTTNPPPPCVPVNQWDYC
jgi:hypothetical protein